MSSIIEITFESIFKTWKRKFLTKIALMYLYISHILSTVK